MLRADRVDVWRIACGEHTFGVGARLALLSGDERDRANRFLSEPARRTFVCVRSALRGILARYVSLPPAALRFSYEAMGKPRLIGHENLHFNLSHSGGAAVVAVASARVGIDIEEIGSVFPELVSEALAPDERERMDASTDPVLSFYAHWTLKEAYLKGMGHGLNLPLSSVRVAPGEVQRIGDFCVASLDLRDGFAAAIAVEVGRGAPFPDVRLFDWRSPEPIAAKAS